MDKNKHRFSEILKRPPSFLKSKKCRLFLSNMNFKIRLRMCIFTPFSSDFKKFTV